MEEGELSHHPGLASSADFQSQRRHPEIVPVQFMRTSKAIQRFYKHTFLPQPNSIGEVVSSLLVYPKYRLLERQKEKGRPTQSANHRGTDRH